MFVHALLMLTQISFAEPTEDTVSAEINEEEIEAFYKDNSAEKAAETPSPQVDLLEEEEFSMDLSGLNSAPVNTEAVSVDVEDDAATVEPVDAATPVTPVEEIEWNLDLSEDLEIGSGNLQIEEKPKSEPVNLDFLEEIEEE